MIRVVPFPRRPDSSWVYQGNRLMGIYYGGENRSRLCLHYPMSEAAIHELEDQIGKPIKVSNPGPKPPDDE